MCDPRLTSIRPTDPKYQRYVDLQTTFLEGRNSTEHMTLLCRAGYFRRQIAQPTYLSSFLSLFGYKTQHAEPTMSEWLSRPIKDLFGGLEDIFDKNSKELGPMRAALRYMYGLNPFSEYAESYPETYIATHLLFQFMYTHEIATQLEIPGLQALALESAAIWLESAHHRGSAGMRTFCREVDLIYFASGLYNEGIYEPIKEIIVASCMKHAADLLRQKVFISLLKQQPQLVIVLRAEMRARGDILGVVCLEDWI